MPTVVEPDAVATTPVGGLTGTPRLPEGVTGCSASAGCEVAVAHDRAFFRGQLCVNRRSNMGRAVVVAGAALIPIALIDEVSSDAVIGLLQGGAVRVARLHDVAELMREW